ncbi:MAG: acyl carrier protein [Bacteroidales bacterium]|nr:acyl carrier protein [Bacteroidales bacterium]
MDLNDFTEQIKLQFLEEDQPKVTSEIDFRKLSTWDSLTGMAIIAIIESEYGVTIPVDDFKEMRNILDLFNYVKYQRKD